MRIRLNFILIQNGGQVISDNLAQPSVLTLGSDSSVD